MKQRLLTAVAGAALVAAGAFAFPTEARAQAGARDMYTRALTQERTIRDASSHATADRMRRVVAAYEALVRRYPSSGYCDNALWQAGNVSALAYQRFGDEADRKAAIRLFDLLAPGEDCRLRSQHGFSQHCFGRHTPDKPPACEHDPCPGVRAGISCHEVRTRIFRGRFVWDCNVPGEDPAL